MGTKLRVKDIVIINLNLLKWVFQSHEKEYILRILDLLNVGKPMCGAELTKHETPISFTCLFDANHLFPLVIIFSNNLSSHYILLEYYSNILL